MKKRFFMSLAAALLAITSFGSTDVFAVESPIMDAATAEINVASQNADIVPFADITEWRYRMVDGKLQRRLWSTTYLIWLTEWEWC